MKPKLSFIGRSGIFLALCAMSGLDAFAMHLQPEEALSVLAAGRQSRSMTKAPLRLAYVQNSPIGSEAAVYVFNRDNAPGFYVLAADDAVGDIVLGYSHNGSFSADNMAPGMKWLLKTYSAQVSRCAASAAPATSKAVPQGLPAVDPLLTTVWNQYEPYNDMCPVINGERSITGCVATAMAQVMKKHQWPVAGTGSYSYVVDGVQVSSDFSSHVYDWDNMLEDYYNDYYELVATQVQRDAVAQLMFDCGVAAGMNYSPRGSGATSMNAAQGMLNYFNYDKSMQYLMRDWYTDDDWMRLMHSQISQGLPVIYGGDSDEGYGHEFILDGYDGDGYFHFNWGWGGYDDGYFSLDYNAPAEKDIVYVNGQEALVNVRPDMGSSYTPLMVLSGVFSSDRAEYDAQSGYIEFSAAGNYGGFYSYALGDVNYELGVKNSLDGNVISLVSDQLPPSYGFNYLGARSRDFPVGEYDVYMVYKSDETDWVPMLYNLNITSGRLHFVNDGTTIIVSESVIDVEATAVTLSATEQQLTVGDTFTLVATVWPDNVTDPTVTWSTSDAAVATVDQDGNVAAVAPGTTTITAACGNVSATCVVTVTRRIIEASGIILNAESIDLAEGDTYQLTATVLPDDTTDPTVVWTTSDASIATIDAYGKVTAIAPGTATITATCGEVGATCEVEVKPLDGVWNTVADGISICVADCYMYIETSEEGRIALYDPAGRLCYYGYDRTIPVEKDKVYIVVIGSKAFKVKV